jgi:hypothetical protein
MFPIHRLSTSILSDCQSDTFAAGAQTYRYLAKFRYQMGKGCEHPFSDQTVLFAFWQNGWRQRMETEFKQKWSNDTEYQDWLVAVKNANLHLTNLIIVTHWALDKMLL